MTQTTRDKKQEKTETTSSRQDVYQMVTDTIVQQLEAGTVPWHRSWQGGPDANFAMPLNATTGKDYRGINILLLWSANIAKQYNTNEWASFKQWNSKGETIRKDEKGSLIVKYDTFEVERDDEIKKIPFLKSYRVFNRCQLASYNPEAKEPSEPKQSLVERIKHVDGFIKNTKARISFDGTNPCYRPATDSIHMPIDADFLPTAGATATENFYAVLTHELTHWTGHTTRLDRKIKNRYGNELYAGEELVAELGAAFLCASLQITNHPKPDHASYIASWLQAMKEDKYAITAAASAASKAVDYLNALQPTVEPIIA